MMRYPLRDGSKHGRSHPVSRTALAPTRGRTVVAQKVAKLSGELARCWAAADHNEGEEARALLVALEGEGGPLEALEDAGADLYGGR